MGGLRFDSMADMPDGMRQLYAKKELERVTETETRPKSKYRNTKVQIGKIKFDSKKESRRFEELRAALTAGVISDLRLQPQFTLQESYLTETGERIRAIRYTADFSYILNGELVVEDVKTRPTRTKEYLRNRKFMRAKYGIDIKEV